MERTAQCHCGWLRVIASGEPERVYVCHCRACQRRTGAVVHSGCAYPKSQVRIEGSNKIYERDADSGFKIRFHFCPNCGSNVFWEGDKDSDIYGITVGSFAALALTRIDPHLLGQSDPARAVDQIGACLTSSPSSRGASKGGSS